ncbi:MAG: T9SS type A sorting domain-containing protein, partial [candidate division WOR-3 bacterium]
AFGMYAQYWASEPPSGFNSLCSDRSNYLLFYDMQFVPQYYEYRLLGKASTDGGGSWAGNANWHGWSTTGDGTPCTACDSNDIGYLVWPAVVTSNHLSVIMFGYASGTEIQVVPYPGSGYREDPYIESNLAGRLYLVWSDSRDGNYEIYFKKSTDGGSTWSNDQRLTNASGNSTEPALVLGNPGEIYVVWIDTRDGNSEVYFKYSEDDGTTWSADTRLTNDPGDCSGTHIAISPDKMNLYVVWNDTRDGQQEVYFKRGTILTGIAESSQTEKENHLNIIPNPFTEKTEIRFTNYNLRPATLKIYDASGRMVKSFNPASGIQSQASGFVWDGTDDSGRKLPAGVYFVQLEAGDYKATEKVILLR